MFDMMSTLFIIMPLAVYTYLGIIFLAIGSFINVVIYRFPLMLEAEWKEECALLLNNNLEPTKNKINLFFPRSFCPGCNLPIKAWLNIPILSFFLLRGKCSKCKSAISPLYPFIEFLCLILSLFAKHA